MKIINFNTLLNYFIYASGNEKIDVRDKCTCGEEIIYISYVTNKETNTETKIGCECIKWWDCEKEAINAIKMLASYGTKTNINALERIGTHKENALSTDQC